MPAWEARSGGRTRRAVCRSDSCTTDCSRRCSWTRSASSGSPRCCAAGPGRRAGAAHRPCPSSVPRTRNRPGWRRGSRVTRIHARGDVRDGHVVVELIVGELVQEQQVRANVIADKTGSAPRSANPPRRGDSRDTPVIACTLPQVVANYASTSSQFIGGLAAQPGEILAGVGNYAAFPGAGGQGLDAPVQALTKTNKGRYLVCEVPAF